MVFLNQDLRNIDEYLNELSSPELFRTPLVIDMDKCILEWDQIEDIVYMRPFLPDLFDVLAVLSDQFEVFFHTLAQQTVAERYINEMKAMFEDKKLGFDFTLISYEKSTPIIHFFITKLDARFVEYKGGKLYGTNLQELTGSAITMKSMFDFLTEEKYFISYKELYYLSAAEQKIAIILEDNILWQRLPAERNPGDFYQVQIFDALDEEDTKLKSFCEFLIARRMFHLNQAYAHKTELNWREHILEMYQTIKKVQEAFGFDVRANGWHEEDLSMYDKIEHAVDRYEKNIAKDSSKED